MHIQYNTITLHNFGSYAHTEISLLDRGFCQVYGENHFTKDNALSNGCGKSTLWSAICFALTGETIQGLTTNLKNIHIEDKSCYVSLSFVINTDSYLITRYVSPKSDLKIIKNGVDISGKGIRESEKQLKDLFPDLTKDLIASTTIIGQGMPNKLTLLSPSGRKDLLEKLTKSDFMIEMIKTKVSDRLLILNQLIREKEDNLLIQSTNLTNYNQRLLTISQELETFLVRDNSTALLSLKNNLTDQIDKNNKLKTELSQAENRLQEATSQLSKLIEEKTNTLALESTTYNAKYLELSDFKNQYVLKLETLSAELNKLINITDVCPTCGQKIPGIIKPDTSSIEKDIQDQRTNLNTVNAEITKCLAKHQEYLQNIELAYTNDVQNLNIEIVQIKNYIQDIKTAISTITEEINRLTQQYTKLMVEGEQQELQRKKFEEEKLLLESQVTSTQLNISDLNINKLDLEEHLAVVKRIDTLVRRDFRGYLLSNIINFLDNKAKEYCQIVFGTSSLDIYLEGNALEIKYDNRPFACLSGGEQRRVDLIIQFAIRDMLSIYLDFSSNILVLDEIFDNLDRVSSDQILKLIMEKLKDTESVFIVSHHVESLHLGYDSSLFIIKNEQGISEIN